MKLFIKTLALLSIAIFLSACEGFLDRQPLGLATDQNFYNDPLNAELAVNAVYEATTRGEGPSPFGWLAHNYEFMIGDILSDDAAKGSTPSDYLELQNMERWTNEPGSGIAAAFWTNNYRGVFRANTVLGNLPEATFDEALKTRLLGETHFLKGYFYFYLVKIFGGVPIFREELSPEEVRNVSRASLEETFAYVVEELQMAADMLPRRSEYATKDLGRATKGAAQAYLARVYMMEVGLGINGRTWQDVYDMTSAVVNSGEYSLASNYATIWEEEGENNSESIFEIQFATNSFESGDQKTGSNENIFQNNRSLWGWGFNNPTQGLFDAFEANDPRRPCTIIQNGDVAHGLAQEIATPDANETGYLNRKANIAQPQPGKSGPQNLRKMRYADVLLMHAEAAYHLGNESEARDMVNMIRERALQATMPKGAIEDNPAGYDPYPAGALDGALPPIEGSVTGQDLLDAIWQERRVELGMEALRFHDLVRTGRYLDALDAAYRSNCEARSFTSSLNHPYPVQPIPLDEVQSWGLEQNPGY